MKRMIKTNQTLAELMIGIVSFGILCQIAGAFFAERRLAYAASLWLGIIAALAMSLHMNYSINKEMEQDEDSAEKTARNAYALRYFLVMLLLGIVAVSGVLNPLITFLGIMGLKIAAYVQPLTHKVLGKYIGTDEPIE